MYIRSADERGKIVGCKEIPCEIRELQLRAESVFPKIAQFSPYSSCSSHTSIYVSTLVIELRNFLAQYILVGFSLKFSRKLLQAGAILVAII